MIHKKEVTVVIPIYKTDFSDMEALALSRTSTVLKDYPITIVCPDDLDISSISFFNGKDVYTERFESSFFDGLDGYNKLLLSMAFYERFFNYTYILICQPDVFIFKDELSLWCGRGYDYIGAPWIWPKMTIQRALKRKVKEIWLKMKNEKLTDDERMFKVGNGGCSLRKVQTFIDVLNRQSGIIDYYRKNDPDTAYLVEDVFFSLVIPTVESDFKIPDYIEAVGFAIDRKPKEALEINRQLPFACHRFCEGKNKKVMMPIIRKILADKM